MPLDPHVGVRGPRRAGGRQAGRGQLAQGQGEEGGVDGMTHRLTLGRQMSHLRGRMRLPQTG